MIPAVFITLSALGLCAAVRTSSQPDAFAKLNALGRLTPYPDHGLRPFISARCSEQLPRL